MCYKVTCTICNKPTWAGCGNHIESALRDVPKDQRCTCKKADAQKPDVTKAGEAAKKP